MNLERVWWAVGALLVVVATIICLVPFAEIPQELGLHDKMSHLIGHGTLALYFAGLVPKRRWWKIFVFLLLFGITIEFAQYYMHAGRNGDPRDVIANSMGAALGLLLAQCGLARWPELAARLLGRRTAE
jgi:glycopeptide antibiotics resistance protein